MRKSTLSPVVINPYRVTVTDSRQPVSNTFYFQSLKDVHKAMTQLDLERYIVAIHKVLPGDEYISEWKELQQGQYHICQMVRRDVMCFSKSFFLCKKSDVLASWYMALLHVQYSDIVVEIRAVDPSGVLMKGDPIISTTLPVSQECLDDETRNFILDWYIIRFAAIHAPEFIDLEWMMQKDKKSKDQLDEGTKSSKAVSKDDDTEWL